jgi:NADH-quinone oxidoreductase subunit F
MMQILQRIESGDGNSEDLDTLLDTCDNILGRSFCALGDGATSNVTQGIKYFRDEFMQHITDKACPFGNARVLAGAH